MKKILNGLVAAVALGASAAEIAFTGADATAPNDLALATNWAGGELPGAEDVAIVSTAANQALTLSSALSVKGFQITPTGSFSVTGTSPLSIGAGGIEFLNGSTSWTFTFNVPITTTAKQQWHCMAKTSDNKAVANLATSQTISGTETLMFSNILKVTHNVAPNYGGRLEFQGGSYHSNYWYIKSKGKVANEVYGNFVKLVPQIPEDWKWSDLFPSGKTVNVAGWGASGYYLNNKAGTTMTFSAGDSVTTGGDGSNLEGGTAILEGGKVAFSGLFNVKNNSALKVRDKGLFYGGSYGLIIGGGLTSGTGNCYVEQTGGGVTNKLFVQIGGRGGDAKSFGEYRMKGGSMAVNAVKSADEDYGLNISSSRSGGNVHGAGVYTQTGGDAYAYRVQFGSSKSDWSSTVNTMTNAFSLFDLEGGVFTVGAGGFSLGSSWNTVPSGSGRGAAPNANAYYRVRLSGGTLKPTGDYTQNVQWDVPAGEGFTLDTDSSVFTQAAPIWGDGTFRKVGTGHAVFNDLTRFTGTLDLQGGTNVLAGATIATGVVPSTAADNCWIWTADAAAEGLADGAEVASWTDVNKNLELKRLDGVLSTATNATLNPTVVANAFNGHAGLSFKAGTEQSVFTALGVPHAESPVTGETNFTVVVVFKTTQLGACTFQSDYQYYYGTQILGQGSAGYGHNGFGISVAGNTSGKYPIGAGRRWLSPTGGAVDLNTHSYPKSVTDGKVHVFVAAYADMTTRTSLDGFCMTRTKTAELAKEHRIGLDSNGNSNGSPFMVGCGNQYPWNYSGTAKTQHAFNGTIAEVRIYRGTALELPEMNALAYELGQKYNPTAGSMTDFTANATATYRGSFAAAKPSAPVLPSGAYEWSAETLADQLAEGAEVTSWSTRDGSVGATTAAGGGEAAPVLVKNALSGKSVVRFSGADKTALGISAATSPITGTKGHTCAVVFRTATDGVDENVYRGGAGLVSTVQNATGIEDWAIALQKEGTIHTGYGSSSGEATLFQRRPFRLADGAVHIAILTGDQSAKRLSQMVDGQLVEVGLTTTKARASYDVLFGSLCKAKDNYFTGDIAAVAMWDHALTVEEMRTVTEHYAAEYAFYPLAKGTFSANDLVGRGCAATNIHLGTAATLIMPYSAEAPFTLGAGQTLTGEGRFAGSYRWGEGSILDLNGDVPGNMDDMQIANGAVLVVNEIPESPVALTALTKVSGTVTVDASALADQKLPSRIALATMNPSVVASGTAFNLAGLSHASAVVLQADGTLELTTIKGTMLIFR